MPTTTTVTSTVTVPTTTTVTAAQTTTTVTSTQTSTTTATSTIPTTTTVTSTRFPDNADRHYDCNVNRCFPDHDNSNSDRRLFGDYGDLYNHFANNCHIHSNRNAAVYEHSDRNTSSTNPCSQTLGTSMLTVKSIATNGTTIYGYEVEAYCQGPSCIRIHSCNPDIE